MLEYQNKALATYLDGANRESFDLQKKISQAEDRISSAIAAVSTLAQDFVKVSATFVRPVTHFCRAAERIHEEPLRAAAREEPRGPAVNQEQEPLHRV